MIAKPRVESFLQHLDEYVAYLGELARYSKPELVNDFARLGAAKYYLQVAVETCIDVANYLIGRENWRRPANYGDAFVVLAENAVIGEELAATLRQMVRFRNRLVHLYAEVDAGWIHRILQEQLGDFRRFENDVLGWIEKQTTQED